MKEYSIEVTASMASTFYVQANSPEEALELSKVELRSMQDQEWSIIDLEIHEDTIKELKD